MGTLATALDVAVPPVLRAGGKVIKETCYLLQRFIPCTPLLGETVDLSHKLLMMFLSSTALDYTATIEDK